MSKPFALYRDSRGSDLQVLLFGPSRKETPVAAE